MTDFGGGVENVVVVVECFGLGTTLCGLIKFFVVGQKCYSCRTQDFYDCVELFVVDLQSFVVG